jgi:O-antigen/teichoic acid export membrane protein
MPLQSVLIAMVREVAARPAGTSSTMRRSITIVAAVVTVAMAACLLFPNLILAALGSSFVGHGVPLLRWIGLSVPAMAINLLFWSTCLVRRRPWPVFAVNLTTSTLVIGGVLVTGRGSSIASVGAVYCVAQWSVALICVLPTFAALRAVRADSQAGVGDPSVGHRG